MKKLIGLSLASTLIFLNVSNSVAFGQELFNQEANVNEKVVYEEPLYDEDIEMLRIAGSVSPSAAWEVYRTGVSHNMSVREIDKAISICKHQLNRLLKQDEVYYIGSAIASELGLPFAVFFGSVDILYDGMYRAGRTEKSVVEYSIRVLKSARKRAVKYGSANVKFKVFHRPLNGEKMIAWV